MNRYLSACLLALVPLLAQDRTDRPDLGVVGRIKTEAFDNSQVMETLGYLADLYGPRLTGSPEFREAANWAVKRLENHGIENVRLEKWGPFGRSWSLKQASLEMVEPRYWPLDAVPLAWSNSTSGPVTGEAVLTQFGKGREQQDPAKMQADLNQYMATWKGKLKGKVVLLTSNREVPSDTEPFFTRLSDRELNERAAAAEPVKLPDLKALRFPDDPAEESRFLQSLPYWVRNQLADARRNISVTLHLSRRPVDIPRSGRRYDLPGVARPP